MPALSADASFVIVNASGQLNGSTSAATPNGSRCRRGRGSSGRPLGRHRGLGHRPDQRGQAGAGADLEVGLAQHFSVLAGVQRRAVPGGQLFGGGRRRGRQGGDPF
ncbi:hypothetical protein, partial [Mycobacterium interjectum]|uniref:hypothetical protein n=1 Tax=Mycobacterium interjectum TaxID=33895 RepID=UPI0021F26EE5